MLSYFEPGHYFADADIFYSLDAPKETCAATTGTLRFGGGHSA